MAARGGHWVKASTFVRSSFSDELEASKHTERAEEQEMAAAARAQGARFKIETSEYAGRHYRRYVITTKDGRRRSFTDQAEAQQFIKDLGALQPKGERWQPPAQE
ncbi:MAG: hypothetical protein GX597_13725 [Anaerolineaceae bacterium]|nr:hypothetical protein [Anaerolineaceae bacterium]